MLFYLGDTEDNVENESVDEEDISAMRVFKGQPGQRVEKGERGIYHVHSTRRAECSSPQMS